MAVTHEAMKAVFDDDLRDLLESLGMLAKFEAGALRCAFSGDVITWDNLYGIFPDGGDVKLACTKPECVTALAEKVAGGS